VSNWFPGLAGTRYATRARVQEFLEVTATQAVAEALAQALQELDEDTIAALALKADQADLEVLEERVDDAEAAILQRALQSALDTLSGTVSGHVGSTSNPHSVTATQVGLGNVDNTSDANKPVSTATQSALDLKANTSTVTALGGRVDAGTAALQALTGAGAVSLTAMVTAVTADGAAQALTLGSGTLGQIKVVVLAAAGSGDSAILAPGSTVGWTEAEFDAAGQSLTLAWTAAGWAITANNGATVT
jgi:hypothetical protein